MVLLEKNNSFAVILGQVPKKHCGFVITYSGNSRKQTTIDLFQFVWHHVLKLFGIFWWAIRHFWPIKTGQPWYQRLLDTTLKLD